MSLAALYRQSTPSFAEGASPSPGGWNYEDSQQDNYEPRYSYHYHVGDYSFYCARPDGNCYCGRDRKDCPNFQHYNKDCQGFSSIYEHNAC